MNVFTLQSSDILQNTAFKFFAPIQSTLLIISGLQASFLDMGFSFNNVAGELHNAGYPYSNIVFNFHDATNISINNVAPNGRILAPFAHVDLGLNSQLDGTLIAVSLTGNGESHDVAFQGEPIPTPEPSSIVLLLSGLAAVGAWRLRQTAHARRVMTLP